MNGVKALGKLKRWVHFQRLVSINNLFYSNFVLVYSFKKIKFISFFFCVGVKSKKSGKD